VVWRGGPPGPVTAALVRGRRSPTPITDADHGRRRARARRGTGGEDV